LKVKPKIKVRDMTVEDLPNVFNIGVREFDISKIYHQYWSLTELTSHFERDRELCIVAETDGEVIGFALGHKRFSAWEENLGYLEWIAVSKEYQRRGVASMLCEEVLKRFKAMGIKRILADVVVEEDQASKKLLEKFSFKELFSVIWFIREA